ncbi:DUF1648 domain-containing protein [Streptomyces sp. WAC06614]|uniref:DUF1648 domain-containing protein n=1 Tax=Streptomyces sp. WAC06614 TaxID=2487416 RepID=UPI0021AEBD05|nr:DUF1648 domain-containing protein [Streptomyces sp. WAC06614]
MERKHGTWWGVAIWAVVVLTALVAMPWAADGRLPERLATHWSVGSTGPDGSMPVWAAAVFPSSIWVALVLLIVVFVRRTDGAASGPAMRNWAVAGLLSGGVFLAGAQTSIVRANLDHADWRQADPVSVWAVLTSGVAATVAGLAGWAVTRRDRAPATPGVVTSGPNTEIPAGERFVWLSRTANPWLHWIGVATGLVTLAAALVGASGMVGVPWAVVAPFAMVSVVVLSCASVQVRVTEKGLSVAFGPLGWPVRHWPVQDIESARAEARTPAQVGGWGYRLSGMGTTVMLR